MREFFEIFNIRFWQYYFFITGPIWIGLIAIGIVRIQQKIEARRNQDERE